MIEIIERRIAQERDKLEFHYRKWDLILPLLQNEDSAGTWHNSCPVGIRVGRRDAGWEVRVNRIFYHSISSEYVIYYLCVISK